MVHPKYDWAKRNNDNGVEKVLNYVATRDWVVAMAPNAVRHLRRVFDLGGAGHLGFGPKPSPLVTNLEFVDGGHSAAIAEDRWDEIAQFIVDGTVPTAASFQLPQGPIIRFFAIVSPLVAIAFIALVLGILLDMFAAAAGQERPSWFAGLLSLFHSIPGVGWVSHRLGDLTSDISDWWSGRNQAVKLTGLAIYAFLLRFITTRF